MLDSMFQEGTDKVLDDQVERPLPLPAVRPSFGVSLWNTTKAPFSGIAAGANESAGFMADMLGAFGQVQAGHGLQADPSLLFSSDERKKRMDAGKQSRDRIQTGEAFSTEAGSSLRATARSFAPDPATANAAEQILFGLGRFGVKAVGYSLAGGPVAGAALTGADEGMTEADRLKAEGVDFETRTKVGIVAGASAAAATALPVAGTTLKGTAALVVAGGPGAFIGQQAASRSILENAGYDKIADQYDPFDPVGLAVSTLVPAAFGAYALRGARAAAKAPSPGDPAAARQLVQMGGNERLALKYDDSRLDAYAVTAAQREGIPPEALLAIKNVGEKSGPTAVSPKGAKGVMQFMDDTWAAYGKGDARDPVASIDAGAKFMKDLIKQYDGNVRAAIAHYNGGTKAGKAVAKGKAPPAKETQKYLERTDAYLAERQGVEAEKATAQDPEVVAAARVQLVRDTVEDANPHAPDDVRGAQDHMNAILKAGDQLAAGERVNVSDVIDSNRLAPERLQMFDRRQDLAKRKTIDQMTPDEMRHALLVDDMTGLGNRRAYDEAPKQPFQASVDIDSLKWVNDNLGHEGGDHLISALGKALREESATAYHLSGDEFAAQFLSEADGHALFSRVRERLKEAVIEATLPDGTIITKKGVEFSYGIANNIQEADGKLRADKAAREASGQRAGRGAEPLGVSTKPAAGQQDLQSNAPAQEVTPSSASKSPETPSGAPSQQADANPIAASIDAQTAEIAKLAPDMMVQLEGMDKPMRVADALEAVKAEAAKEVQDAPLLQVAAECFLRSA